MGDGLKLSKDKRHRSSSSIAGAVVEGTRSERKLDIRGSIPEGEDQFALADARCDDLQEKIDLVKVLKRKRKLRKRSMTRVNESPAPVENIPFITVRTQPKKKVLQARLRRLEPPNPVRGYVDPVTTEQHNMIGQVRGYNQAFTQPARGQSSNKLPSSQIKSNNTHPRRILADGDSVYGRGAQITTHDPDLDAAYRASDSADYSDNDVFEQQHENYYATNRKPVETWQKKAQLSSVRRSNAPKDVTNSKSNRQSEGAQNRYRQPQSPRRNQTKNSKQSEASTSPIPAVREERSVVELFNKSRGSTSPVLSPRDRNSAEPGRKGKKESQKYNDQTTGPLDVSPPAPTKKEPRHPRKLKYRSRRYELPTVASQMKQAGVRYFYDNRAHSNIPFVVSKSTAPSHNIGVNIQQVLNGLKIQQPLSGIPPTIAHHMGLGHIPSSGSKSTPLPPPLDHQEINAIRLGRRLVRLPSYKYISYNRLLNLYREGDGMVPRFLKAISRPHYFYTSMYNLAMNREDLDGATSKGHGGSQAAKQSLAEYASLYREYEQIDKCLKDGNYDPEWEQRRDELTRELAAREEHIRRVVQEYRASADGDQNTLRASMSNAEDGYRRQSSYRLNLGDPQPQQ